VGGGVGRGVVWGGGGGCGGLGVAAAAGGGVPGRLSRPHARVRTTLSDFVARRRGSDVSSQNVLMEDRDLRGDGAYGA